jgi:glutaredoxin
MTDHTADSADEKPTLADVVNGTPEGQAAVQRAMERSIEVQNDISRQKRAHTFTHAFLSLDDEDHEDDEEAKQLENDIFRFLTTAAKEVPQIDGNISEGGEMNDSAAELNEKLAWVYTCQCERCKDKEWHTQSKTGCPTCDWCHDNYRLFTNAEVKKLLESVANEAHLDELEKVMEHLGDRYNLAETTYPSVTFVANRIAALQRKDSASHEGQVE